MATNIQKVPIRIIQAIEQEGLSRNQIMYYDREHGWMYQRMDIFINSMPKSMEENTSTNLADEVRPLERLGPFGTKPTTISLTIVEGSDMYRTKVDQNLNRLNIVDGYGQHAPIAPITLTGRARDVAYIPNEATHFCWIYPPIGLTQLKKQTKARIEQEIANGDLEYTFLALGGFAYFRYQQNSYEMLQANCLVQADNGLTFQGPFQWNSDYTANLAKQGRFQGVTISTLLDLGIKYYCFINPNEKLTNSRNDSPNWIPAPNGGFIYLYSSNLETHIYDRYFCIADKPLHEQISTHIMPFSLIHKRNQPQTLSIKKNNLHAPSSATSDIDNQFLCSICFQRTVRCIFIPCKHMCTCSECAQEIRQRFNSFCPICRKKFHEIWDVFL